MDSTSVDGLELLVFEGPGGKALATDHLVDLVDRLFTPGPNGPKIDH